ncbi:hypothetical protein Dimus_027506, partial [Dionaea muscipula]
DGGLGGWLWIWRHPLVAVSGVVVVDELLVAEEGGGARQPGLHWISAAGSGEVKAGQRRLRSRAVKGVDLGGGAEVEWRLDGLLVMVVATVRVRCGLLVVAAGLRAAPPMVASPPCWRRPLGLGGGQFDLAWFCC